MSTWTQNKNNKNKTIQRNKVGHKGHGHIQGHSHIKEKGTSWFLMFGRPGHLEWTSSSDHGPRSPGHGHSLVLGEDQIFSLFTAAA